MPRRAASDVQLSENFFLSEFTYSDYAIKKKLKNIPDAKAIENLRYLCEAVLQPLRSHIKKAVKVSSGFRTPEVNLGVGGVPSSDHVKGEAADISVRGMDIEEIARLILELNLPVDQVIVEHDQNVVHVSCVRPKREFLQRKLVRKKIVYSVWSA